MKDKVVYCKVREGYKVKVGVFKFDEETQKYTFIKHRAHLMRVIGPNGGYGIQKYVLDESNHEYDIQHVFRKHPYLKVFITDYDTGQKYVSVAEDWLNHQLKGNYGDGKQVFLSVDYMKHE